MELLNLFDLFLGGAGNKNTDGCMNVLKQMIFNVKM